jgi:hypothetical protein
MADTATVSRSSGISCYAGYSREFCALAASSSAIQSLSFCSVLSCIGDKESFDGISLSDGSATVESVNFTSCSVPEHGCALGARSTYGSFAAKYLTVFGCAGRSMGCADSTSSPPSVEASNFVSNTIYTDKSGGRVLSGERRWMTVTDCIFQGTSPSGRDLCMEGASPDGALFAAVGCVFSGTGWESFAANAAANSASETATRALSAFDGADCPLCTTAGPVRPSTPASNSPRPPTAIVTETVAAAASQSPAESPRPSRIAFTASRAFSFSASFRAESVPQNPSLFFRRSADGGRLPPSPEATAWA